MAATSVNMSNLDWSFLPLNIWLQWTTGVDALTSNKSHKIRLYQCSSLAIHFICQVYVINYITREPASVIVSLDPSNDNKTTTNKWNTIIDYINWTSVALVCHISILTSLRHRFSILMSCFRRSSTNLLLDISSFYIKLRRLSFICVACIILFMIGLISMEIWKYFKGIIKWKHAFVNTLEILMVVHLSTSLMLFAFSGQVSSFIFKSIQKQISPFSSFIVLQKAKHSYTIACETVDSINNCFGWICLATIQFSFVGLINSSFYLFGSNSLVITDLALFFTYIIFLVAICWTADDIRHQAKEILSEIRRLPLNMQEYSQQMELVRSFIALITQSPVQVNAISLFSLNRRLIPQAIGTTLTYFFILYQFQASEVAK